MPSSSKVARSASSLLLDSELIEAVPLALRKFHPGKGAILVRMVEQIVSPSPPSNHHHPIATALTAAPEYNMRRVLALGGKGLYLSDPNGTVVRVAVYDDIRRIATFQKYLYLSLASRQRADEDDPILLCLSPFPENTRNNADDIVNAIAQRCRSDVAVDRPSRTDVLVAAADVHDGSSPLGLTSSTASSPAMHLSRSFDASPLQTAIAERFHPQPEEWRSIVEALYAQHCPEKVSQVPRLLEEFHGQEMGLLLGITKKYRIAVESVLGTVEQCLKPRRRDAGASNGLDVAAGAGPNVAASIVVAETPQPSATPCEVHREQLAEDLSPTNGLVKAIEAASNATGEFEEPSDRLHDGHSEDDDGAPQYPQWGAQDNDVNQQWCPTYLEERIAEAALASIVDEGPDDATAMHDDPQDATPSDAYCADEDIPDALSFQPQDGDACAYGTAVDHIASPRVGDVAVPVLDHSAMRGSPLWSGGAEDSPLDGARTAGLARPHIHVPSLEQHQLPSRMPQFDDFEDPPARRDANDVDSAVSRVAGVLDGRAAPMAVYKPCEVRSSSPLPSVVAASSTRGASSLYGPRRTFGTGRLSSLNHDEHSLDRGDDFLLFDRPLWEETVDDEGTTSLARGSYSPQVMHHDLMDVGSTSAGAALDPGPQNDTVAPIREEPRLSEASTSTRRHSPVEHPTQRDSSPRQVKGASIYDSKLQVDKGTVLFHEDEIQQHHPSFVGADGSVYNDNHTTALVSCFNASPAAHRYFVAANATEALHMLAPEHASAPRGVALSSTYEAPPHLAPIYVDELIRIAKRLIVSDGRSSPTAACLSAMDAYSRWSAATQACCFISFEALFEDAWSCDAFLRALAPLVGNAFDSILLTLSLPHRNAKVTSVRSRKLHCPRLMFAAFVCAWDTRSRFVLKATSRHGTVVVENVALAFLDHLDRSSLKRPNHAPLTAVAMPSSSFNANSVLRDYSSAQTSFSDLWALGNVLVRVEHLPYSGGLADVDEAMVANAAVEHARDTPASSSLPLAEWNDLVARWNAMHR